MALLSIFLVGYCSQGEDKEICEVDAVKNWIRSLLTKRVTRVSGSSRKLSVEEIPPSELLVMLFQFSLFALLALSALEIAHLALLGEWNGEIFAAITGIIGTIMGILIGSKK